VTQGAPAEVAGLKKGDVITAVDGKPASSIKLYELRRRLRNEAAGTVVDFTVSRAGETAEIQVTLKDLI
jgi:S1-C subfamily serine protease